MIGTKSATGTFQRYRAYLNDRVVRTRQSFPSRWIHQARCSGGSGSRVEFSNYRRTVEPTKRGSDINAYCVEYVLSADIRPNLGCVLIRGLNDCDLPISAGPVPNVRPEHNLLGLRGTARVPKFNLRDLPTNPRLLTYPEKPGSGRGHNVNCRNAGRLKVVESKFLARVVRRRR